MSYFRRKRIQDKRSDIGIGAISKCLVLMCGMPRVFESEEERSCLDGE